MLKHVAKLALAASVFAGTSAHAIMAIPVLDTQVHNGHTYMLLASDTWTQSQTWAQGLGGNLVSVNDAAEQNFLNTTWGTSRALWLGFARTVSGTGPFAWVNGDAVTYTNWSAGEPNNVSDVFGLNEDYVHTYAGNSQWNDLANTSGYAGPKFGVVEIPAVPEPETLAMFGLGLLACFVVKRKKA